MSKREGGRIRGRGTEVERKNKTEREVPARY